MLPLRMVGWKYEGAVPPEKKCVVIAYPHTSNWDAPLLVALAKSIHFDMAWMIKDDWFKGPMGPLLRSVGAVAVNRKGSHNLVDQMVAEFAARDSFHLVIPPDGTRSRADYWRSGFYHIANNANVPVVPGYLDYARKVGGLGAAISLTGDVTTDMNAFRSFYENLNPKARVPGNVGPIRLREEG